jgi:hypothetical protein
LEKWRAKSPRQQWISAKSFQVGFLIDSFGLQQYVVGPTHERSATHKRHTLDLVMSRQRNHLVSKVYVGPVSSVITILWYVSLIFILLGCPLRSS